MPLVDAGRLNQRVTILVKTVVRGDMGGHDETWAPLTNGVVWAEIVDMSGREIYNARAMGSEATKRITIRWRTDVKADQRVQFSDGTQARVEWIREVRPRLWIEMFCLDVN